VTPTVKAPAVDRLAIVDEYGDLSRESAAFSPKERRLTELRKIIQGWYESEPPAKDFIAEGKRFAIAVGPREYQKKVHPGRLYKLIGLKRLLAIVSVTLEALKAAGLEALSVHCVDTSQTGKRKLTPVAMAQAIPITSARKRPIFEGRSLEERAAA
jgi:hypothetical protein